MTAPGRANTHDESLGRARATAFFENIRGSLRILLRPPRLPPSRPPLQSGEAKSISAPPIAGAGKVEANFVPAWRRLRIQGALAICAVALAMLFLDAPAHEFASGLPTWLIDDAFEITDFGRSGWILIPLGALILIIALFASRVVAAVSRAVLAVVVVRLGYLFIAVGLPGLVVTVVKRWIGRVRPSDAGPFTYEPFSWRPEYASFPSGHATTAFAALVAFGLIFPRSRPVLWLYALLVAASRVAVSAHYTSDVIAGAAFGAFGALLVRDWFAARRLGFFVGRDGAVHRMAGPSRRRIKQVVGALIAS
jgi:membrane-associated phospholipid phosphatase